MNKLLWNVILICAVLMWHLLLRLMPGIRRLPATIVFTVMAGLSFVNYVSDLSRPLSDIQRDVESYVERRIDPYDLTFYYLNSKYFHEIGYFDLYSLLMKVAVDEKLAPFNFRGDALLLQNREEFYFKKYDEVIHDDEGFNFIRSRFSETRWVQFLKDTKYLLRDQRNGWNPRRWTNFFWDHGFNATPGWLALFTPITQAVPVELVKYLCLLDGLLFYAMIGAVALLFGFEYAAISLTIAWNSFSTEWPLIGVGIGRYDYVALLVASMLLAYRKKPIGAGICFGIAAAFRFVPLALLPVVIAQYLWCLRNKADKSAQDGEHNTSRKELHGFTKGFLISFLALHLLAFMVLPKDTLNDFRLKMTSHGSTENLTRGKVGLKLAMSWDGDMNQIRITEPRKEVIRDQRPIFLLIAGVLTLGIVFAALQLPLFAAISLFPMLMFIWSMPSYHYFVLFVLPVLGCMVQGQENRNWWVFGVFLIGTECVTRLMRVVRYDAPVSTTSIWCICYALITIGMAAYGYWSMRLCKEKLS